MGYEKEPGIGAAVFSNDGGVTASTGATLTMIKGGSLTVKDDCTFNGATLSMQNGTHFDTGSGKTISLTNKSILQTTIAKADEVSGLVFIGSAVNITDSDVRLGDAWIGNNPATFQGSRLKVFGKVTWDSGNFFYHVNNALGSAQSDKFISVDQFYIHSDVRFSTPYIQIDTNASKLNRSWRVLYSTNCAFSSDATSREFLVNNIASSYAITEIADNNIEAQGSYYMRLTGI